MKVKLKNKKCITIIAVVIAIIAMLSTLIAKNVNNRTANLDSETLRAMSYEQVTEADGNIDNCQNVKFSAFFTRDLNNDGYAERIKGTCKDLSDKDTLYVEINVLTQGYLENGQITLNANNFKWTTSIVSDNIVDGEYIGETHSIKLKDQVPSGSQKLLWGTIKPNVGSNINDYSQISSITLTGTYVDDEGNRTEINKTVDFTVDWYGTTNTIVNKYYYSDSKYTSYDKQLLDISTAVKENNVELNFKVAVSETNKTLLLQKQVAELTIPEINGYKPTEVLVLDKNVEYNYNDETSKLIITRNSTVDEIGNVTSQISRSNINNVKLVYPLEAYENMTADSMILNIPMVGYNYGYNNSNEEFENPQVSMAEGILTVTYSKISGSIWNAYATAGNYERTSSDIDYYRYVVSKEAITNIYNGNVYEDEKTTYPVKWQVGVANCTAISKITLEEQKENEQYKSDRFLTTQNKYINMYDYIKTTGIYFENASTILGNNGWIKLYNAETGSLIETFTSSNWSNFSKDKPYVVDLKSIKIETSNPVANTVFYVYQIKEIDDELISKEFSKEDFERLSYIYTYLHAKIEAPDGLTYEGGETTSEIISTYYAYYEMPYSVTKIKVSPEEITNQKTENVDFVIDVLSQNSMERKWKNGVFLIELPEDIINADIKDVSISDEKVELSSYEVVEDNGKSFIKIYTLNGEEALYKITVNADVTANPLKPTSAQDVKLYSYNENGDNYKNKIEDKFDIDADGKTSDYIGLSCAVMSFVAPSGLLTTEYVTNYDDLDSTTIAPNVADIEKSNEARTATINISITNGYSGTISDIVLLGKIPFEGNTYILNEGSLNSQYTANITGEIKIPEKVKQNTVIYYSNNENPSKDLNEESNGWKLAEDVTDWKEIKTYLIVLSGYCLEKGENEVFTYEVEVPGGLGYNSVSYSDHAVYYNLDTENGKLATKTEPNKVGIQVVSKYGLQLTKNKKSDDTTFVNGATYSITTTDVEGNLTTKTATTDKNGTLKFSGIYVGREYTLKEVASPRDYELSTDEVKFSAKINEEEHLEFTVLEGEFKEDPQMIIDENGNYLVTANVEDEAKYTLIINKTDEKGDKLAAVKFIVTGKGIDGIYRTNENGLIKLTGLYLNEKYEMQEIKANGYYVDSEARILKLERNVEGKLEIITEDEDLKNVIINEEQGKAQAIVTVNIQNEKIPTYNLKVLKVESKTNDEGEEKLEPLVGASFKLISEDLKTQDEYRVDEDGCINISDLYTYVEGKNITGKYILQETKAPDGYSNNAEQISFKVIKSEEGNLQVEIENEYKLSTFKSATIENNTLTLVIEDKPLFKITKVDSETGARLADAQFVIYELDENGNSVDFAKDVNGNYVGEKNQYGEYIITTDKNGEISLPLRSGYYKIEEVGYPDGYYEQNIAEIFIVDKTETEKKQDENKIIEINYIEDLVDLSNQVNRGNKYTNTTIKLMRTLDFDEIDSYDPEDRNRETLKVQLTSGSGFTPIGYSSSYSFSGTFDGQNEKGFEIRNLYINRNSDNYYVGLFGYVNNATIKNLGITGEVSNTVSSDRCYTGGIVAYMNNSSVSNCYNKADISGNNSGNSNSYTGGIAGYIMNSSISNSFNTGRIISKSISQSCEAGGIVGDLRSCNIRNCYNTGYISAISSGAGFCYTGGILGCIFGSNNISNCYNIGTLEGVSNSFIVTGGIVGQLWDAPQTSFNNNYCLNTVKQNGKIDNKDGKSVSEAYMISKEFYDILNKDKVWSYIENDYPVLTTDIMNNIVESIEINIENKIKKFKITTDVLELNGEKGGSIDGEDEDQYETVTIYESNKNKITMTPKTDYAISNITVNGEQIDYEVNEDGTYTISAGYFKNMQEDKHIVVTYTPIDQILIINKVDENDSSKTLEGAKFMLEQIDDRPEVTNEVGSIVENGAYYDVQREYNEGITGVLGNVTNNGIYYYEENDEGKYVPNNIGISGSEANSYIEVDLTNKSGEYGIVVNAEGVGGGLIYGIVTEDTEAPNYNYNDDFLWQTGTTSATDYMSQDLQGGRKYYLHLGYMGVSGNTSAMINSIQVVECNDIKGALGELTNNGDYYFIEENGAYIPNNSNIENGTTANSYIKLDLTNMSGKFVVVVNAEASTNAPGWVSITDNTNTTNYFDTTGRFVYIASSIANARAYTSTALKGGKEYYIHLGYLNYNSTSYDNQIKINSIKVYEASAKTYNFDESNGKYISNNQNAHSTVANSYIPIDLTDTTGKYNLKINAEISSESGCGIGYVTITQDTTAPAYNSSTGRLICISGAQSAKDYTTILTGGNMYYVHLGYYKNASISSGTDTFTINNIELSLNKDDYFYGEYTTNEYGQVRAEVPSDTTIEMTEVQAPDGYTLNKEPIIYTMKSGEDNVVTITNKRKTSLTIHHYLKQNDGTYTTLKVAEDDYQEGDIGENYTTAPKVDLENLSLEKVDEKYVIPSNATGTYGEDPIEVIYYYELNPINLKINHYINGTNISLAEEKIEQFNSEITFNESSDDENIEDSKSINYTITTEGSYEINTNDDYKNLIKSYELVKIESSVIPTLNSDDTLEFTENAELRYYYQLKDNIITTEVKEHTENRTNPVTNTKEETQVKGGTITGENQAPYEIVEDGKNSTKGITATPDEGYTIKQIILESIDKEGNKTETIIYGEEQDENAEVSYKVNEDGSITLVPVLKNGEGNEEEHPGEENPDEQNPGEGDTDKDDADYLFKNVTENKHIIVEFEPILSEVVVHYYMAGTGEEYGIDPVYPQLKDGTNPENIVKNDFIGEPYATKSHENVKDIYHLESVSGDTSGTFEENVKHIYYYYDYNNYAYEIHYFYDGVEDESKVEYSDAKYGETISEYPDKPEGYIFNKVTPVNPDDRSKANLQITEDESKNIINVYYGSKYEITTEVLDHTENYKDGTTKTVKGGTITGEDETPYEEVAKYEDSKKVIKIVPDAGYEIAKVIIKNGSETIELDVDDYASKDGTIILPEGYFKNVQNNIHVEVEFKKKSKVTIKYLEEGTEQELLAEEKITGSEGDKYVTARKPISQYQTSSLGVTYEDLTQFDQTKDNVMYADDYTIIYWYKKVESGIIVRHIEINEKDKKNGLTLESGIQLDEETYTGNVDDIKETLRKTASTDEKYKNYISVNGPEITEGKDETTSGDESEDKTTGDNENEEETISNVKNVMIIVSKDEDSKTGTFKEQSVVEIRYYYEKQYNITTEVKPHEEKKVIDLETGEIENVQVDGGTISGNKLDSYEKVLNMGANKEAIVITPEKKYRVKQVTINGKKIDITKLENENHIVTIPGAQQGAIPYFKEVDEDKHIVVEFERIPAKVIVEYRDVDTKEEIKNHKTIGGLVDDEYETTRPDIKDYIKADPEPENATGTMTEDTITVTYWYTKQFKITTDVIEHFEEINGEVVSKKGGEITGEDLLPYETVNRGKNNTLAITMKPEKGYRIAEIKINGKTLDYSNDENIVITESSAPNATQRTVEIPEEYFKDMQEDKHITVSYERIPTKVIVKHLEDGTDKPLSDDANVYGYVYDKYETKEKDIEYYELVKEKYPENSTGTLTEDTITVKYYYKKLKFNMKVEKEIGKVTLNGENVELTSNNKLANIKIDYKDINKTNLEITYKIKVTNTEKVAGTATIEELIPEGFEFVVDQSDIGWKLENGRYLLETEEVKPGETKEYNVTLRWIPEENNKGQKKNTAKITNTDNVPNYEETTKADNEDEAEVNIKLNKTIQDIIDNIKDGKADEVIKDIITNVKTGDTIIISVSILAIAGIAIVVTIIKKSKLSK